MLEYAREGDTVGVSDISRLARSTRNLLYIIAINQMRILSLKEYIEIHKKEE